MALFQIQHASAAVMLNLPLNIILPDPALMNGKPVSERKVLYLLHGLSDDATAWQRFTSIEMVANAYGLVVVMPSVGRSFYADLPNGQRYFTYITEELPQYLNDVFHLKPQRADTLIAGNSMGGYGAFKIAFAFPERFAAAGSFSGVLSFEFLRMYPDDPRRDEFTHVFGDLKKLPGSQYDPAVWFQKATVHPERSPRLYMSCGRNDDLFPINQLVSAELKRLSIPVEYHEYDAFHNWFFWDADIRRFLEFALGPMPIQQNFV